jgi:multisubunit Na+/H+ antiporter MnhF subunit
MVTGGLSERHALIIVRMSAAALRYMPRPDPDPSLRDRIVALAHTQTWATTIMAIWEVSLA